MTRGSRSAALVAAVIAAALASCQKQPKPEEATGAGVQSLAAIVATCASSVGEVQVKRSGGQSWEAVQTGAVFRVGDEVKTGALSFVRVEFLTGGGLELEENASVVIDQAPPAATPGPGAAAGPENRVSVQAGVVRGFLPQATEGAEPLGLVIRTTEGEQRLKAKPGEKAATFRVTRAAKKTELAVTQGEARVATAKGERSLRRGQAVEVAQGEMSAPVDLLDFPASVEPGIDARFQFKPDLTVRLAWKPVAGAVGYRVQVAHDLAFQAVEQAVEVAGTDFAFAPKATGVHVWRVAARDGAGRYGEYGFARRLFAEKEAPRDLLVGPEDGAVLRFVDEPPPIAFSWESAGAARRYRVVVASGPNLLEHKVMATATQDQRVELEGLGAGSYYWGVFVDDAKVPEPIFTKPRRLVLLKAEKPKVKVPKSISEWGK
ncbi:MAG TPA: hypothetical protein VIV59_12250 [Anaeromyxobacteraceae bacterium]